MDQRKKSRQNLSATNQRREQRRLIAVMFTDIVGYSSLTAYNEKLALALVEEHRAIIRKIIPAFGGHENRVIGDAFFIEFSSAVEAVSCAREIQVRFYERNQTVPADQKIILRVGLHLGDVIDFDNDRHGGSVNIAARIETLADPAGVFLTRQIYDQVVHSTDSKFELVGRLELKNIPDPVEVYRLLMPWAEESRRQTVFGAIRRVIQRIKDRRATRSRKGESTHPASATIFAVVVAIAFAAVASELRLSAPKPRFVGQQLPSKWQYALENPGHRLEWNDYDERRPYLYTGAIRGPYLLRLKFRLPRAYERPAIVLGVLPRGAEVYMNGTWIGGGNELVMVEAFSFDGKILRQGLENELRIKGPAPGDTVIGIGLVKDLGISISESEDIKNMASWSQFSFYVTRALFLAVSLIIAVVFTSYYILHRERRQLFYLGLFFALMSILLTYYNSVITGLMPEIHRIALKGFSLSFAGFALASAYLAISRRRSQEVRNNMVSILGLLCFAATQWPSRMSFETAVVRQNITLHLAFFYSALWTVFSAFDTRSWWLTCDGSKLDRSGNRIGLFERLTVIALLTTLTILILCAFRSGHSPLAMPVEYKDLLRNNCQTIQFVIGVVLISASIIGYFTASLRLNEAYRRDDLTVRIKREIETGSNLNETIRIVHNLIVEFSSARRSTIYLSRANGTKHSAKLVATSVIASPSERAKVQNLIVEPHGLLGYVLETQAPVLVHDVAQDTRFRDYLKSRGSGKGTFRTSSCMILPLIVNKELLGVLTLADPDSEFPFSAEIFQVVQNAAKDLALLISLARRADSTAEREIA